MARHPSQRARWTAATLGALLVTAEGCAPEPAAPAPPPAPPAHAGGQSAEAPPAARQAPAPPATDAAPDGWPDTLVTGPGTGPGLFLGPDGDAPPVGYVSPGTPVELRGAPRGARIPVTIGGDLEVRAWLPTERLAARVQSRGRVAEAPGYVGPGDVVRVLGMADEGIMRIEMRPPLREGHLLPSMEALYPAARLGARQLSPDEAPGPNPGTPMALPAGQPVDVYDRPGGEVVASLPALDPPLRVVVLVDDDPWKGVRVGTGPHLLGFVQVALAPADDPEAPPGDPLAHAQADGPVPIRLMAEPDHPLWRLAPGTRITFDGETLAIAHQGALAREMERHGATGEVDVFVAVDDTVAVRGMVDADALKPTETAEAPSDPASQTERAESPEPSP